MNAARNESLMNTPPSWTDMPRALVAYVTVALCALALWIGIASESRAQSPVVVELFTAQGCSSCPPADEILHELAGREDVIALALHVDYWDYIGWQDSFADPAHAERQRGYATVAARRSIYTPQMIVNGTSDVVGAKPMQLAKAIAAHAASPALIEMQIARVPAADAIMIEARAGLGVDLAAPLSVYLVQYTPLREAEITRGENAGNTFQYAHVVESWQSLGTWNGRAPLNMRAALSDAAQPVVVLIQEGAHGPIRAAARLR